jgi:hypothetical protein
MLDPLVIKRLQRRQFKVRMATQREGRAKYLLGVAREEKGRACVMPRQLKREAGSLAHTWSSYQRRLAVCTIHLELQEIYKENALEGRILLRTKLHSTFHSSHPGFQQPQGFHSI